MFKFITTIYIILTSMEISELLYDDNISNIIGVGRLKESTSLPVKKFMNIYSTWVACNKYLVIFNLIPVILSNDKILHFMTCNTTIIGISSYYFAMHHKIRELVISNHLPKNEHIAMSIMTGGLYLPAFILTDIYLAYNLITK